jgi:transcriptional regulator with XRE-family HTH domain
LNLSIVRKGNQVAIEFGRALRSQRRASDISQEALALAADVDRTFVSQMERGIRQPTLTTLWKLATALKVKPSILVVKMEGRLK